MSEPIVFRATFPLTDSAFKAHGGGGFRITLDIPESEADEAMTLLKMRGKELIVTAQVTVQELTDAQPKGRKPTESLSKSK